MFYKKRIDTIADKVIDMDKDIEALKKAVSKNIEENTKLEEKIKTLELDRDALIKSNESYKTCIEEIQKHEEAIAAVISNDRKDINALIAIIRKLQNKRK